MRSASPSFRWRRTIASVLYSLGVVMPTPPPPAALRSPASASRNTLCHSERPRTSPDSPATYLSEESRLLVGSLPRPSPLHLLPPCDGGARLTNRIRAQVSSAPPRKRAAPHLQAQRP